MKINWQKGRQTDRQTEGEKWREWGEREMTERENKQTERLAGVSVCVWTGNFDR